MWNISSVCICYFKTPCIYNMLLLPKSQKPGLSSSFILQVDGLSGMLKIKTLNRRPTVLSPEALDFKRKKNKMSRKKRTSGFIHMLFISIDILDNTVILKGGPHYYINSEFLTEANWAP